MLELIKDCLLVWRMRYYCNRACDLVLIIECEQLLLVDLIFLYCFLNSDAGLSWEIF